MNNSRFALSQLNATSLTLDSTPDLTPTLREEESRMAKIIGALQEIQKSKAWSTLKTEVFNELPITLSKELQGEARKDNPDTLKLSRLAGQLKWAEKYADLSKLEGIFRQQLTNIRSKLHGKT